jgi:ABC-type nitrate/sulfonate/bicarbonate transport system substrate-binding protein
LFSYSQEACASQQMLEQTICDSVDARKRRSDIPKCKGGNKMKYRILCVLAALWFLTQAALACAQATGSRLRIAFAAPSTTYLPLWVAKDAGFFEKYQLSAELVFIGSSPIALSALLAGEIDILAGGGTVVPRVYMEGNKDLALFAGMNNKLAFAIYSHPSITEASELRSKRVGVTRFGGTMDFATRYFLKQSGFDPVRDVKLIQIGRVSDILGALVAGSIDVGTMAFPYNLKARSLGFHEIADLTEMKVRYASTTFVAERKFLGEHEPQMKNFVKAIIEGIYYAKTNRNEALKILSRYTRTNDMEILGASYDFHKNRIWPRIPKVEPQDLELILEQLSERDPQAASVKPSDLIYGRIVDEVAASGFADKLYAN